MGYYDYAELRASATAPHATQETINKLGAWCSQNITQWNGEFYDIDDGLRLYPIVVGGEDGWLETVSYEIG